MKITRYECVSEFYEKVKEFLLKNEAFNILPLGIISDCIKDKPNKEHIFIFIEDDNNVKFVMIQNSDKMVLTGNTDYVDYAIDYLENNNIKLNGIIGEKTLVDNFAQKYSKRVVTNCKVAMNQRIYKLDKLNNITKQKGKLRLARIKDLDILIPWIKDFAIYAGSIITIDKAKEIGVKLINSGILSVWEDKEIVSMVAKAKKSLHGRVVNWVYTPPKYRCKGYASTCVHEFSQELLEEYDFCALYTDLSNPISNSIYIKIGYEPVGDSKVILFSE